jgi:peptide/nickel transport system permease protein
MTSSPISTGSTADDRSGAPVQQRWWHSLYGSLAHDKLALVAAVYLLCLVIVLVLGTIFLQDLAVAQDLQQRNLAPFSLSHGFQYILGSDSLGRSVAGRIIIGGARTLSVSVGTVIVAMCIGTLVGIAAGYKGGILDSLVMRVADVSLAFPGILLAVVLLYIFPPSTWTVIVVLVVNRLPLYARVSRAETLEVRQRLFVSAARVLGAGDFRIMRKHILPIILPTILTVATLDMAVVMLLESSLSFLGMGVQPPGISWGLMVSDGRRYLRAAWWLTFFAGLAIVLTAIAVSLVSNWLRVVLDPVQAARLHREKGEPEAATEVEDVQP